MIINFCYGSSRPPYTSALSNVSNVKISDLIAFLVLQCCCFPLFALTRKFAAEVHTSKKLQDYENIYGGDSTLILLSILKETLKTTKFMIQVDNINEIIFSLQQSFKKLLNGSLIIKRKLMKTNVI